MPEKAGLNEKSICRGAATISECGRYRYVLRRSLGSILRWYHPALFIMLNPSTADAEKDDPTIRRCISFAKREGFTHLNVVNLFALRATDPKELLKAADPVGPENDEWIQRECVASRMVIAAWGSHPFAKDRAAEVYRKFGSFMCLGKTKHGHPRHPLYVPSNQSFMEFKL